MARALSVIKSIDLSSKTKGVYNICYGDEYRFSSGASEEGGASLAKVICRSCWGGY